MKILVTGACGYVGSDLCTHLLTNDHQVIAYDTQMFGNGYLPESNEHLTFAKHDIRDLDALSSHLKGCQGFIHLAGITSDKVCQDDPHEASAVNREAFEPMVRLAKNFGVKRFIFLSSVTVYGSVENADENHPLRPKSAYGIYKAGCEPLLWRYSDGMKCYILRPAGVFGYAPRMRFDLTVNRMTAHAVEEGVIHVQGGEQKRPHVHVRDLIEVITRLLRSNLPSDTFNVVHVNQSVAETARIVKMTVEKTMKKDIEIVTEPRYEDRSYTVNGEKLSRIVSFRPRRGIEDAVQELCTRFKAGYWKDVFKNPHYLNLPNAEV